MPRINPAPAPFYAIRHIPTGFLLPCGGKKLRGHTHQDPSATRPPRLFKTQGTASSAMKAYIKGKWVDSYSTSFEGTEYDGPDPKRGTERKKEDFELVECWITIKPFERQHALSN